MYSGGWGGSSLGQVLDALFFSLKYFSSGLSSSSSEKQINWWIELCGQFYLRWADGRQWSSSLKAICLLSGLVSSDDSYILSLFLWCSYGFSYGSFNSLSALFRFASYTLPIRLLITQWTVSSYHRQLRSIRTCATKKEQQISLKIVQATRKRIKGDLKEIQKRLRKLRKFSDSVGCFTCATWRPRSLAVRLFNTNILNYIQNC